MSGVVLEAPQTGVINATVTGSRVVGFHHHTECHQRSPAHVLPTHHAIFVTAQTRHASHNKYRDTARRTMGWASRMAGMVMAGRMPRTCQRLRIAECRWRRQVAVGAVLTAEIITGTPIGIAGAHGAAKKSHASPLRIIMNMAKWSQRLFGISFGGTHRRRRQNRQRARR